jgi:hypothetical protein
MMQVNYYICFVINFFLYTDYTVIWTESKFDNNTYNFLKKYIEPVLISSMLMSLTLALNRFKISQL